MYMLFTQGISVEQMQSALIFWHSSTALHAMLCVLCVAALTALRMLLDGWAKWTDGMQHISALQNLQHLQLQSDTEYPVAEEVLSIQGPSLPILFRYM
jgi:hypothetical protein